MKKIKCPKCKHDFIVKEQPSEEKKLAKDILSAIIKQDKTKFEKLEKRACEIYGIDWEKYKAEKDIKNLFKEYGVDIDKELEDDKTKRKKT